MMQTSIMVVDDFIGNAEGLRQRALELDYPEHQGQFPGRNSRQRLEIPQLSEAVSHLLGERVVPTTPLQSHAKCRVTLGSDQGLGRVHIDVSDWSGILYLSRPEDCRGGTDFFRHRRTGTDRFPVTPEDLARTGFSSFDEAHDVMIGQEGTVESAWERIMTVPMRFNRLLLLRPWLWHTAGPGFGDVLENGRLVYLMFFVRGDQG